MIGWLPSSALLVLPAGVPWALAAVCALLDGRRVWVGRIAAVGVGASFVSLVVLGWRVLSTGPVQVVAGGWPAGVGIVLRADVLGITFAAVSVGVILVSLLYEVSVGVRSRTFPALVLFMTAGLNGLFLTGDIFNFYVFFEVSMTAAYVLTGYREKDYQVRAAFIFAIVNLFGSVVFLISVASLYHLTGSLEMQTVAARASAVNPNSLITIAAAIFVAFSLKLGLFPFHLWLPAVYVGSHPPVAAILAGALANIGSYGLLRFGGEILPEALELGTVAVLVLGSASIIYGALQAVSRRNTDEVLAYSTIGQAGYILLALGVGGTIGFSAAVIYAVINSLNKALLFLAGSLRGPLVGAAFAIGAFSVVGVPPAVGFIGKIAAFKAGLAAGGTVEVVALLAVIFAGSALSFIYMFQLYQRAFLADKPGDPWQSKNTSSRRPRALVVLLAALVLVMGLWPEPLLVLSEGGRYRPYREPRWGIAVKRVVLEVVLLTLVYAMVLTSFDPFDLLFGAVLSAAMLYTFRAFVWSEAGGRPDPLPGLLGRLAAFFPFAWAILVDVVKGTWEVSLVTLHLRPLRCPGVVKVPVGERTPTGVAVSALVTTLSPGAFLIEANEEFMMLHLIDASDPDAVREKHEDFYQRYQRKVFP